MTRDQHLASDKGIIAEVKFELECLGRGVNISKPIHPKSVYDYIVELKSSGNKLFRVQVKYTSCTNPSGNFKLTCAKGSSSKYSKRQQYYADEIDYMVGLTSEGDWYILPMHTCPTTCITLGTKYEQYKNNWSFM